MNKNAEAQAAFEIWNKLMGLGDILWDHYYEAFLDLIVDEEEREQFKDPQDDLFW